MSTLSKDRQQAEVGERSKERSVRPEIVRYAGEKIVLVGLPAETDNVFGEHPVGMVVFNNLEPSPPMALEKVAFTKKDAPKTIVLTSDIDSSPPKKRDSQLSILVPTVETGADKPRFSITIDHLKKDISLLSVSDGLVVELISPKGMVDTYDPVLSQQRGKVVFRDLALPVEDLPTPKKPQTAQGFLQYGDRIRVTLPENQGSRQITFQLYFGTEGSGIYLKQTDLSTAETPATTSPESVVETEAPAETEAATAAWLESLKQDEAIWRALLAETGLPAEPHLRPIAEHFIGAHFATETIKRALAARSHDGWHDRMKATIDALMLITIPAFGWPDKTGRAYYEELLERQPDADLIAWALDAKIRQEVQRKGADQTTTKWDYTRYFFSTDRDYQNWLEAFQRHEGAVKNIARDLELDDLTTTELKFLALSLRLGIEGDNPYERVRGTMLPDETTEEKEE